MRNWKKVLEWRNHPWFWPIAKTHIKLSLMMPGYEILDIKEKWYSLRFYPQVPRYMLWLNYHTRFFERVLDKIYEILATLEEQCYLPASSGIKVELDDLDNDEFLRGFHAGEKSERHHLMKLIGEYGNKPDMTIDNLLSIIAKGERK